MAVSLRVTKCLLGIVLVKQKSTLDFYLNLCKCLAKKTDGINGILN